MSYPLVNSRALGRANLFSGSPYAQTPGGAPAQVPYFQAPAGGVPAATSPFLGGPRAVPFLGQGNSQVGAQDAVRQAKAYLDRVAATYPNLVTAMGESSAQDAYNQAKDSYDEAVKAYEEALAG